MEGTTSPGSRDCLQREISNEISLSASSRALASHHNELAPISRLPGEILAIIFSFLSIFAWNNGFGIFAWIYVAHVCRRWRETALNHPRCWSHINLTKLATVGMGEILSRAKMAPLHLEADFYCWRMERIEVFGKQLEDHISHTRHLKISGRDPGPSTVVNRLVSPTLALESLSLSAYPGYGWSPNHITPDNLFDGTAPNLTTLELEGYYIGWKSPLLKGLRILKIRFLSESVKARPELNDWLDALNEMPQLSELTLRYATPVSRLADPLISRTVTLPSLTYFYIHDSAKDVALALAHLVLPTLIWLHTVVESRDQVGEDVLQMIPYAVRYSCARQDLEPIRSILIDGRKGRGVVSTWTTPGITVGTLDNSPHAPRLLISATGNKWYTWVDTKIINAVLTLLPMSSVSTLTAKNELCTRPNKAFWLSHAPRLPFLEQVCLVPATVRAFGEMLAEDTPPDGPRLPSLTRLILFGVVLNPVMTYCLVDMLINRVEQGVPLEYLDLRNCVAVNSSVKRLAEIVVDVQEPLEARAMEMEFPDMHEECGYGNGCLWYWDCDDWDSDSSDYEDGDDSDEGQGGDEME